MTAGTLSSRFLAAASASPGLAAVCDEKQTITYSQLLAAAGSVITRWARLSDRRDPVAVLGPPGVSFVVALVAAVLSGRPYVPIDVSYPAARIAQMLLDSGARILSGPADLLDAHAAGPWRLDPWLPTASGFRGDDHPRLAQRAAAGVVPGDLAYIVFTSGSTGRARAVGIEHRAVVNLLYDIERRYQLQPAQRGTWWTSCTFDVSAWEIWSSLTAGAELHVVPECVRWQPDDFVRYLLDREIHSAYVPPAFVPALGAGLAGRRPMAALRRLLVGVEPIPLGALQALKRSCPELVVINGYGPAEATICCTLYDVPVHGGDQHRRTPIGHAVTGADLYILDSQRRQVPRGEVGELHVGGIGLARGYLNDERANLERFVEDLPCAPGRRFYRTGDMVRQLPTGALEFVGRSDRQFKVHGYRVEAAEIESAASNLPELSTAVAGVIHVDDLEALVLYVVASSPDSPLTAEQIRAALRRLLPVHAVPAIVVALSELPQTPNGKIDHNALRRIGEAAAPTVRTAPEHWSTLLEAWARTFGLSPEAVDQKYGFIEMGGTSLEATTLSASVRTRLGRRIEVTDILRCQSFAAFEALAEGADPISSEQEQAVPGTEQPATLGQESVLVAAQMSPEPLTYTEAMLYRVDGTIPAARGIAALASALGGLPTFRTRISSDATGRPTYIFGGSQTEVRVIPVQAPADNATLRAHALDLASSEWDLDLEPPCRAAVLTWEGYVGGIVIVAHHSCIDGQTEALLVRAIEQACADGIPAEGAPGLAAWLAAAARHEPDKVMLDALAASLTALPGPGAGLPGAQVGPAGRPVVIPLPGLSAVQIRDAARQRGVTPFVLMASAAQRALSDIVGSRQFPLLIPVDARDGTEMEVAGCLATLLPFVADARADNGFDRLLRWTSSQVQLVMNARRFSFANLTPLCPAAQLSRSTAEHICFSVNTHPNLRLPGATGHWIPGCFARSKCGVDLVFEIHGDDLVTILVEWNAGAINEIAAAQLANRAGDGLRAVCQSTAEPP